MDNEIEKTIYDLEISLLRPEVRTSKEALDKLLADDFREFGSWGAEYTKKDTLENLPKESEVSFSVIDFEVKELSPNIVLATYRTLKEAIGDRIQANRSSIWRKTGGGWQMVFHQGTPIK